MKSNYYVENVKDLRDIRSQIIRVFLSSTYSGNLKFSFEIDFQSTCFTDVFCEIDSLIENVFF